MPEWMQWAWDHGGHLVGSTGLVGAIGALMHARAVSIKSDARVRDALTDAMSGMRADLAQARSMAAEALTRASRAEDDARQARADHAECRELLAKVNADLAQLRIDAMSQHS